MTPVPQAALPAEFAVSPAEDVAAASCFASGLEAAHPRAFSPSATATIIRDLCELFKLRVVALVLVTGWGGFYLGRNCFYQNSGGFYPGSTGTHISVLTGGLWCALLGIGLVSAGAGALNEAFEHQIDARMKRTAGRPVAAGRFSLAQGVVAGLGALALGAVWLTLTANLLTAVLALLTAFTYVAVYTPLKRVTALATFIGAFPGAMGPVLGWTAARGRIEWPAVALFAILFVWQFPHLMSIAWLYREDYARAGIRVLPVVDPGGRSTVAEALSFALLLIPVSLAPWTLGLAGATYAVLAAALGLVYLGYSIRFARILRAITENEGRKLARDLLKASILYLPLLIAALMFCATAKR
jgi:protoheme IX farnesyltransferase